MAKSIKEKKKERDLVDRLRGLGLRKKSAKNIAGTVTNVKGQLPDSARTAISELISKVDDLRGRPSKESKHGDQEAAVTEKGRKTGKKHKKAAKAKARKKANKVARETAPE